MTQIEKQIRSGLPQVGSSPYGQIHAHSTGNANSTAQNEADYMNSKDINTGFYSHVVGNGRIIQVAPTNNGYWDVGGGWNQWGYAAVELIESHNTQAEFDKDYAIYVQLLRDLADEAGIEKVVDDGSVGITTHSYCTNNQPNNNSDHVDPYPYLAKWGISKAQFKKDVESGNVSGGNITIDNNHDTTETNSTYPQILNGTTVKFGGLYTNKQDATEAKGVNYSSNVQYHTGTVSLRYVIDSSTGFAVYQVVRDDVVLGWINSGDVVATNVDVSSNKIAEDGAFGASTATALQKYYAVTADGVISNQYKQECNQYIYAAEFNDTLIGSNVVRKLQATLGLEQDGLFGESTIKALQKRYGTTVDGIISPISSVVKELQKHLNNNTI